MARGLAALRKDRLTKEEQLAYKQEISHRRKSVLVAYLAWLLLGWHYAYVGKWGWQCLYWFTGAGLLIWMVIDFFRIPGIVGGYNETVADTVTSQITGLR